MEDSNSNQLNWKPVGSVERRVLGVLVEKAKTTPDVYPLSLNALCTGCNQKNNRFPVLNLTEQDVDAALDKLRPLGAASLVQGMGRVNRYRHHLYEWLGVDKVELAVMAELLLRGAQTVGELRARASRMEPIADQNALRGLLDSLKAKGLVIPLNREGRGHAVTHALYLPKELDQVKRDFADDGPAAAAMDSPNPSSLVPSRPAEETPNLELDQIKSELAELREQLRALSERYESDVPELLRFKQSLES